MNEKEFDELLELGPDEVNKEQVKMLHRQLNRKIFLTVFKHIVVIILVFTLSVFAVSKVMDLVYYNPMKKSVETETKEVKDFEFLMNFYTGLLYPEYKYTHTYETDHKKGFGQYELYGKLTRVFDYIIVDNQYNVEFNLKRNHIFAQSHASGYSYGNFLYQFIDVEGVKEDKDNQYQFEDYLEYNQIDEEMIKEISSLPDSSRIEVVISFDQRKSLDEVVSFMKEYKDSSIAWIAINHSKELNKQIYSGIHLNSAVYYDLTKEAEKEYPSLQLHQYNETITAKELEEAYLSRLKLLNKHSDFIATVENNLNELSIRSLYKEAKNRPLESIGVYGSFTKQELLKMMKEHPKYLMKIEDVSLSVYDRQ